MFDSDQSFNQTDFTEQDLSGSEFDTCQFHDCNFARVNLTDVKFIECVFENCDLSLATLNNTALRDYRFTNCKLLGLRFDECNAFGFEIAFDGGILDVASFFKLSLKKMHFKNLRLHGTDFTESDLTEAVFENCDLQDAIFDQTNLEKADFRTSVNYSIHPETNRIRDAKFSASGISGLLERYDIEIDFGG